MDGWMRYMYVKTAQCALYKRLNPSWAHVAFAHSQLGGPVLDTCVDIHDTCIHIHMCVFCIHSCIKVYLCVLNRRTR